jgi:carbon monoxide dehydrogenase subunit G
MRFEITRDIHAPIDAVFQTVADIRNFSKALPHVVGYEFLSESESGLETRFLETRVINCKEEMTELEITEYVSNERVRMVADSHGAIWDTLFTVAQVADATRLSLFMDARSYKIKARIMNAIFQGQIAKAVAKDIDLIKDYCEAFGHVVISGI